MIFNVAKDFSQYPGARYARHSEKSGEELREKHLRPLLETALQRNEKLTVDLDGTAGMAASFIEEAFGGLVRAGFGPNDLDKYLVLKAEELPEYAEEARSFIQAAGKRL